MALNSKARKRIMKDIMDLTKNPLHDDGIYVQHDEDDITRATACIFGPEETPYAHGAYIFEFKFPNNYPFEPPVATLITQDPKRKVRLHPNLYVTGKVCLSILNTWGGPSWTAIQTFSSLLLSIQSILNKNPLANEPGFERSKSQRHQDYIFLIRYANVKYAIIQQLQKLSSKYYHFRPIIKEHFLKNYRKIEKNCLQYQETDEMKTFDCRCYGFGLTCHYSELLSELSNQYRRVIADSGGGADTTSTSTSTPASITTSTSTSNGDHGIPSPQTPSPQVKKTPQYAPKKKITIKVKKGVKF